MVRFSKHMGQNDIFSQGILIDTERNDMFSIYNLFCLELEVKINKNQFFFIKLYSFHYS